MTEYSHLAITTLTERGTFTEHWTTTPVEARKLVARYIATHGLRRDTYGYAAPLFRGDTHVGHYSITPL